MKEYKLPNGHTLTEEEMELRAKQWENGSWSGHIVPLRNDLPCAAGKTGSANPAEEEPHANG